MKRKTKIRPRLTLKQFDYELPPELISQQPIKPREQARLLILDRAAEKIAHRHFFDLPEIMRPGDVLVFNDSKVIPARLSAIKETGGKVEIFLLKKLRNLETKKFQPKAGPPLAEKIKNQNIWEVMIGGKVNEGQEIFINKTVRALIVKRIENNLWQASFDCVDKELFSLGRTPLPPYIKKAARLADYQTVFAKHAGSVAAPTAGLHFSKRLLRNLKKHGVQLEYLTLHVGLGTFASVKSENILEHKMHSELAAIDPSTAKRLNAAKRQGRRIIAVGTTAVRTLETFSDAAGRINAGCRSTDIFIYPGYEFKFADGLITNFHLPKSTLLMLLAAFCGQGKKNARFGISLMKKAYQEAIKKHYRFYSFGDGMLIE